MAAAGGSHDHHAGQPDGDHDSHDIDSGAPPSHCLQLTDLGIASPSAIAPTFSKLQMPDAVIIPHHEAVQINLRRNLLSFAIYHPPPRPSYFLRSSRLLI